MSQRIYSNRLSHLIALAAAVSAASVGYGAQISENYIGPASGFWNTAANWSTPGTVPNNGGGNTYNVHIATTANATVALDVNATIDNLTIDSGDAMAIDDNRNLAINSGAGAGSIANNGTLTLSSGGNITSLQLAGGGTVTLSGSGTLTSSNFTNNLIYAAAAGSTLINQSSITGSISFNQTGGFAWTLNNQGTISGTLSNALSINTGTLIVNTGTLQANTGGVLTLIAEPITNTGGVIKANGGTVNLQGVAITNGTLNVSSGTMQTAGASTSLAGAVNITNGQLSIADNTKLTLTGGGTYTMGAGAGISLNSAGNVTDLILTGTNPSTVTLAGSGALTSTNFTNNRIYTTAQGITLLNSAGTTISGAISMTNAASVTGGWALNNQGTITATQSNPMLINPGGGVTNTGTLEASALSTLNLQGDTFANTGGFIKANGGTVKLTDVTIAGGTLDITTGTMQTVNSSTTLTGAVNITGGQLSVADNTKLTLTGGSTYTLSTGAGISLNSGGNVTDLILGGTSGTITFTGAGSITGNNNQTNNRIYSASSSTGLTLLNSAGTAISGTISMTNAAGTVGGWALNNQGTITGTQSNAMFIAPGGGVTNTGTLQAAVGGVLTLGADTFTNTGGLIQSNGGTLNLEGATIVNGTLDASSGTLKTINGGGNTTLSGTPIITGGSLSMTDNTKLVLSGGGTYTLGTGAGIFLNSAGNLTDIILNGANPDSVTLTGSGSISSSNNTNNRIYAQSVGMTLINQTTISGSISMIVSQDWTLNNQGTVTANQSQAMTIAPGLGVLNSGLMQATTGGVLTFQSGGSVNNTGSGTIKSDGGTVNFSNMNVTDGNLTTVNGGVMRTNNGNLGLSGTPTITTGSTLSISDNTILVIGGNLVNNGTLAFNSGGNLTDLQLAGGTQTISGTGSLTSTSSNANRIYAVVAGVTLINQATITGSFDITTSQNWTLDNQGTITGNQTNALFIRTGGGVTNTGTIQANNGGVVQLSGEVFTNTGGLILADVGSHVNLAGSATFTGGTLQSIGTGFIQANASQNQFNSLTIAAGTHLSFNDNTVQLLNAGATITNNGTITLSSGGNLTDTQLTGTGTITLSGTGTLASTNSSANRIYATSPGITLVNDVDHTIQGSEQMIVSQNWNFTNNGSVIANQSTPLNIATGGTTSNTGLFKATSGATLLSQGVVTQVTTTPGTLTGGTWWADASSLVNVVVGTPIATIGLGADVVLNGSGSAFTIGGIPIDTTLTTNSGQLHIMNRTFTALGFTNNDLLQLGAAGSVTNGGGVFIAPTLANFGTIEATGTGNILTIAAGITDPPIAPIIQIDASSTLDISAGGVTNSTGQLIHNGTNLTIGNDNILVSGAYTNASFGTGNAFNKHANVTTTGGKILAAGDNMQSLTGPSGNAPGTLTAAFTGGTTTTPSLNFGNVHVTDAPTLSYQIHNNGTSGPSMLFALQTSVNGGNITDGRISSSPGVAAGNVGPLFLNTPSAAENVTFNATSDGPLTGQTLHIANNFDNNTQIPGTLAEQTLSITGTAWNLAAPVVTPTPVTGTSTINLGNFHEGAGLQTATFSLMNNAPNDGFSEKLDGAVGSASGNITISGNVTLLAPQATDSTSLTASFTAGAGSAGHKSGTATLALSSDGQAPGTLGNSGLGATALSPVTLNVTADVYRLAAPGPIDQNTYNIGTVHVGDFVFRNPSFSNTAVADGFSETLLVNIAGHTANAGVTSGSTNGVVLPGSSHGGFVSVVLDTSVAQLGRTGSQTFHFQSDGTGASGGINDGLGITDLTGQDQTVTLTADVLNYAVASLSKESGNGSFTVTDPTHVTLDFGTLSTGQHVSAQLGILNNVSGPADTLGGSWTDNAPDFTVGSDGSFSGLAAGNSTDGPTIDFTAGSNSQSFSETLLLSPVSSDNAGDFPRQAITVTILANVNGTSGVPEPASLTLLGLGGVGLMLGRRRAN